MNILSSTTQPQNQLAPTLPQTQPLSQATPSQQSNSNDIRKVCGPLGIPEGPNTIGNIGSIPGVQQLVSSSTSGPTAPGIRPSVSHTSVVTPQSQINSISINQSQSKFVYDIQGQIIRNYYCVINKIIILVSAINVSVGSSLGGPINQQAVVAPNVALDPTTNSVIGGTNPSNLQSQTSVVNTIHQAIVTAASSVLTSNTSTFPPNADINSNVSC